MSYKRRGFAGIDMQGCNMLGWTWENPQSAKEIIKYFKYLSWLDYDQQIFSYYSLKRIAEHWEIDFCKVSHYKCRRCGHFTTTEKHTDCYKEPMVSEGYFAYCFNCNEDKYSFEVIEEKENESK